MKRKFYVYVPELHYRKVEVRANNKEDAIGRVYQRYGSSVGSYKFRDLEQAEVDWVVENA